MSKTKRGRMYLQWAQIANGHSKVRKKTKNPDECPQCAQWTPQKLKKTFL